MRQRHGRLLVVGFVLLAALAGIRLSAQVPGGVKPAAGITTTTPYQPEFAAGSDANGPWPAHPGASPMLNLPHPISSPTGVWNFGESATAPVGIDRGGFLDWLDPGQLVLGTHVHPYIQPTQTAAEGWQSNNTGAGTFWRLRGYLRNAPRPAGSQVTEAAFEVIVAADRDPGRRTVIVLMTPETFRGEIALPSDGIPPDIGPRFGYGGWRYHNGLERNQGPTSSPFSQSPNRLHFAGNINLMERNQALPGEYNLVCVRVMPVLIGRPARFQMQRNLEVVRAVQKMMADPGTSLWRPNTVNWQNLPTSGEPFPLTCVIEGGSLGGAVALWSAMLFPSDFHGAVSSGACPSIRSWVGEQEAYRYVGTLSGFNDGSHNFNANEALHYAAALWGASDFHAFTQAERDLWSPFFHVSSVRAWQDGMLRRPVYALISDEDYISTGVDAIPWLSQQREFVISGSRQHPSTNVKYFWSIAPRSCHFGDQRPMPSPAPPYKSYPSPTSNGWMPGPYDYTQAILAFLHEAVASRDAAPIVSFVRPTTVANATLDPWDHALQPLAPPPQPPTAPPAVLKLGTFGGSGVGSLATSVLSQARVDGKSFGSGTNLGKEDSTLAISFDGKTSVYAGSAEGVVTRFVVNPNSLAAGQPGSSEVVPMAMSEALGFGAWAICEAQANGTAMKEIIVGTERGLHILVRTNLGTLHSVRDLPWELGRPRGLQCVDVIPGGYEEVVFFSQNGALAVYKADPVDGLKEYCVYGEPGIVDMKVLSDTEDLLDLALLSDRGHVLKMRWDLSVNTMTLLAVSPRLNGVPLDMELAEVDGNAPGKELVALMNGTDVNHKEALLVFRTDSLAHASTHRITGITALSQVLSPGALAPYGGTQDLEVVERNGSAQELVILNGGQVIQVPIVGGGPPVIKDVASFPPMMRPLDLLVHEGITSVPGAQRPHEVFVTTEAGYACWFSQDEFLANVTGFSFYGPQMALVRPTAINAPHMHCNRTTSATWGMDVDPTTMRLELLDQSGTRWSVDGAGNLQFRHHVGWQVEVPNVGSFYSPLPGPHRTLRRCQGSLASSSGHPEVSSAAASAVYPFQAATQAMRIETQPLVPKDDYTFLGNTSEAWSSVAHQIWHDDGYLIAPLGGDLVDGLASPSLPFATRHFVWWGGQAWFRDVLPANPNGQPPSPSLAQNWPNRIQGIYLPAPASQSTIQAWWSTAGGHAVPAQGMTNVLGHDLRNQADQQLPIADAGALRMFLDPVTQQPRIAASTTGGRLLILEAGTGPTNIGGSPKQSDASTNKVFDYGTGGTALAVAARLGTQPRVDIYFGVIAHFPGNTNFSGPQSASTPADDITSAIVHLEYQGAATFATATVLQKQILRLDGGTSGQPKVFGVCGIAVGELVPTNTSDEIVVCSLDGHIIVYERLANGDFGPILYQAQVAGSLGVHNGILITEIDPAAPGNELYVAGSLGLRKWVRG